MYYIKLAGGTVYDPSNGVDGQRKDIWVAAGQVVEAPETTSADSVRTIDADGMVVMPGGVDMHCHIAGPKVNAGRKMQPEQYAGQEVEKRDLDRTVFHSGAMGSVPTIFTTGYKYIGLGYTTCFDAAISPMACLLYTSPSPRDQRGSRMPSSA